MKNIINETSLSDNINNIHVLGLDNDIIVSTKDLDRISVKSSNKIRIESDAKNAYIVNLKSNDTKGTIEINLPKYSNAVKELRRSDYNIEVNTNKGNVILRNLLLAKLYIASKYGNINLKDIDSLYSKITTIDGNIDMEFIESLIHYNLNTYAKHYYKIGTTEKCSPSEKIQMRELIAVSNKGDVKILFKGKRY